MTMRLLGLQLRMDRLLTRTLATLSLYFEMGTASQIEAESEWQAARAALVALQAKVRNFGKPPDDPPEQGPEVFEL